MITNIKSFQRPLRQEQKIGTTTSHNRENSNRNKKRKKEKKKKGETR